MSNDSSQADEFIDHPAEEADLERPLSQDSKDDLPGTLASASAASPDRDGLTALTAGEPTDESDVGVPHVTAAPKRLLGMKRPAAIIAFAGVALIFLTVVALIIGNAVITYNENRQEAVDAYDTALAKYEVKIRDAKSTVSAVQEDLLITTSDDLQDESFLSSLEDELELFEATMAAQIYVPVEFDLDEASTEEIDEEASTLSGRTRVIENGENELAGSFDEFLSDKEAKRVADEEARVAAELAQKKASAGLVSFEDLFRAGESVFGTYYKFDGKVIQDAGSDTYRVSITQEPGYSRVFWKNPILVTISGETSQRILEDDIISFVALSMGIQSYESVFGQTIELPIVLAEGPDVTVTGRDD